MDPLESPGQLNTESNSHTQLPTVQQWDKEILHQFLRLRQELFLDPLGSNRKRFEEAAVLLQRALFEWYFSKPGAFRGLLSFLEEYTVETRKLRKEEHSTLLDRRFSLNWPGAEVPAVESGVSENQWQKIYGSFNTSYEAQRLFERFLTDLDEYTNPSLRINHRYLGELLPHDNMVSYFAATAATFLNENAVIGKVSPCVTHMEQAAVMRLAQLVGWEGQFEISDSANEGLPVGRLPTCYPPSQNWDRLDKEQPTGTIVGDGTIANISAILIARNATFDYLLGWGEATQSLGPQTAWEIIKSVYEYRRMIVITSKGSHFSVTKACHTAGVGPLDVIEVAGSENPWILDGKALAKTLKAINHSDKKAKRKTLLLAVVAIAGKTETGYIDRIDEIAEQLDKEHIRHPTWNDIDGKQADIKQKIVKAIEDRLGNSEDYQDLRNHRRMVLVESYLSSRENPKYGRKETKEGKEFISRLEQPSDSPSYNRPFLHVDAAHGGAFLAVPSMRESDFEGINLADTVTLDGHKMFYCYYPCGGLLVRTNRWARTLHTGRSGYISEETNRASYGEDRWYLQGLKKDESSPLKGPLLQPALGLGANEMATLAAAHIHNDRPVAVASSELRHQPFVSSLEGSRGCQGIMQMYFNLNTIGLDGYKLLLEWTRLLSLRCSEAVSLGRVYVRQVVDEHLPLSDWMGNGKYSSLQYEGDSNPDQAKLSSQRKPKRIAPVLGGRLIRLSDGSCNQLLISYIPQQIAADIISKDIGYWEDTDIVTHDESRPGSTKFWQTLHYLWRVNEHLWVKYLYANPAFTYYVGHTDFEPILPNMDQDEAASKQLEHLLCDWNVWTRWRKESGLWHCPFFEVLTDEVRSSEGNPGSSVADSKHWKEGFVRFFSHKIVVMHPYTDESILSDMLGKLMFWGERSAEAVRMADAACQQWLLGRKEKDDKATPKD